MLKSRDCPEEIRKIGNNALIQNAVLTAFTKSNNILNSTAYLLTFKMFIISDRKLHL